MSLAALRYDERTGRVAPPLRLRRQPPAPGGAADFPDRRPVVLSLKIAQPTPADHTGNINFSLQAAIAVIFLNFPQALPG
jgi:hypothetical protein